MSGEARIEARDCRLGIVILCSVESLSNGTLGHDDGEVEYMSSQIRNTMLFEIKYQ